MSSLACISVTGCRAPLRLLEQLSFSADQLLAGLPTLRKTSGAEQLAILSTCERTELYAVWRDDPDCDGLVQALAGHRGLPFDDVDQAAGRYVGPDAVRHLFRVATGLESFVLGDRDVVGQVRAAMGASRTTGVSGLELDRLMDAAVNTSRRAHRATAFAAAGRSVGTAAVEAAVPMLGGTLAGRRLLVVGAGQVAAAVVTKARALGAEVTVCNRTRRHADRFLSAGATVADLSELEGCLATADLTIVSTAAPHPLVGPAMVRRARRSHPGPMLVMDLCLPRNVDPAVRDLAGVRLVDLADLRAASEADVEALVHDAAAAERIVVAEVERFRAWFAARPAVDAVRRMRDDFEAAFRQELDRLARDLPGDLQPMVEQAFLRVARRLAHGPTRSLLTAAEAGEAELVALLAGLFAPSSGSAID